MFVDSFWAANAGIPTLAFIVNFLIRLKKKLPLSAGADWVLVLFSFDMIVALQSRDFERFFPKDTAAHLMPTFLIIGGVGALIYLIDVLFLEDVVERGQTPGWSFGALFALFGTYVLAVGFTYIHLRFFRIGG